MRKLILSFLLTLLILSGKTVLAEEVLSKSTHSGEIEVKQLDKRAKILADYLATHNSPLEYHAQDFIDAANKYSLDWKLVAAISGVESTFGKFIPGGFNGWGWGVYGTQALYFESWRDGIYTVSRGLRENYIDKGYTEPYSMNRIYAESPTWGSKVTYFMKEIEGFAKGYELGGPGRAELNSETKIAVFSGQLNFE